MLSARQKDQRNGYFLSIIFSKNKILNQISSLRDYYMNKIEMMSLLEMDIILELVKIVIKIINWSSSKFR